MMEISDYSSGKNANRFGCVRQNPNFTCDGMPGIRRHSGIDIQADIGTDIASVTDEILVNAIPDHSSFGKFIIIKSGNLFYLYAHLDNIPNLSIGSQVSTGDIIGSSGDSATPNEPHLHLEVRQQINNESYNDMLRLDIENYLITQFDINGNTIQNNCN